MIASGVGAGGGIADIQRSYLPGIDEAGDVHGIGIAQPAAAPQPALLPAREESALPPEVSARDPVMLLLSRVLGARLSTDNLAWRGDPVPAMRSLQKMLVGHSLTLPENQRTPAMRAIRTVELAVRWRLRWMQMRRSEAESNFLPSDQDDHATQTTG